MPSVMFHFRILFIRETSSLTDLSDHVILITWPWNMTVYTSFDLVFNRRKNNKFFSIQVNIRLQLDSRLDFDPTTWFWFFFLDFFHVYMFVYQTFYVNRPNTINNDIIIPESEIIIFTGNYKKNIPATQPQTTLILKHFFPPFLVDQVKY